MHASFLRVNARAMRECCDVRVDALQARKVARYLLTPFCETGIYRYWIVV
jgi:hypothetical protein